MRQQLKHNAIAAGEAVMSFDEIAEQLGISRNGAYLLYRSAMKKIAQRQGSLQAIRELVELRRQPERCAL